MKKEDFDRETSWAPTHLVHDGYDFFLEIIRNNDGSYYNWVCILGHQSIADKFEFVIRYNDKDGNDVVTYRGKVISIDVSKENRPTIKSSVFVFHDVMLRETGDVDDKKLNYKFTVQKFGIGGRFI